MLASHCSIEYSPGVKLLTLALATQPAPGLYQVRMSVTPAIAATVPEARENSTG